MKYTVYVTRRSYDRYESETFYHKPRRIKYYETEAESLLDAMAKFAKDEKMLIKENTKLGWTVTHTANGYISECSSFGEEYTDFTFNS